MLNMFKKKYTKEELGNMKIKLSKMTKGTKEYQKLYEKLLDLRQESHSPLGRGSSRKAAKA